MIYVEIPLVIHADVGKKVMLNCISPLYSPTVIWRYQSSNASNYTDLVKINEDGIYLLDKSGRFSVNKTGSSNFRLVIHETQLDDSGNYTCYIYTSYKMQNVTVLNVTDPGAGGIVLLLNSLFTSS